MRKTIITTITLFCAVVQGAWAQFSNGNGTDNDPYIISNTTDLDYLATTVNGGEAYSGKHFKLDSDITYTGETENFTAIGSYSHPFNGHFNGNNKTISGIRLSKGSNDYQGLFGATGSQAVVENFTLADTDIAGKAYTGGIVGFNRGTVTHVTVSSSVTIRATQAYANFHGGIVGQNHGDNANDRATLSHCTSSATLTIENESNCSSLGGIAGVNFGEMSDNLAFSVTVPTASSSIGAVAGNWGTPAIMQRNYYRDCTIGGTVNALGMGCNGSDLNTEANVNGAVSIHTITLANNLTVTSPAEPSITHEGVPYYVQGASITLTYDGLYAEYCEVSISPDATVTKSGNEFSFTLPVADVTATTSINFPEVTYIDANGEEQTATPQPLTFELLGSDYYTIQDGWYIVNEDIHITKDKNYGLGLIASGVVHLILADDHTLTVGTEEDPTYYGIGNGRNNPDLYIYGQSKGNGKLVLRNQGGFGIIANSVTINGGDVDIFTQCSVDGTSAAIQTQYLTFNSGKVHLSATNHRGIDCSHDISLNWNRTTDSFYSAGFYTYSTYQTQLCIAEGKAFVDEDGNIYKGTLDSDQLVTIADKTLRPLEWPGAGTADDPYLIGSTGLFELLASRVSEGNSYSGKFFKLTDDISTTTMVGTGSNKFSGSFDGNGKTLSVTYETCEQFTAPFRYVNGATFTNLTIAGTITTSEKFAGGLIGNAEGDNTISACHVSVSITSTVSGDGTHGGFIALVNSGNNTISDSWFSGSLLGEATNNCGGFVGWAYNDYQNVITLNNCLFNPTRVTIATSESQTFVRCRDYYYFEDNFNHYVTPLGNVQGYIAYTTDPSLADHYLMTLPDGYQYYVYAPVFWRDEAFRNTAWGTDYETATEFTISNAADLAQFAYLVDAGNDFYGKTIKLTADIDLGAHYWMAAGSFYYDTRDGWGCLFRGTFNGDNHTISNLRSIANPTFSETQATGLFGCIKNATVKNLILTDILVSDGKRKDLGGIVAYATESAIENCHILSGTITNSYGNSGYAGGIAGNLFETTISGCFVSSDVTVSGRLEVGGIAGHGLPGTIIGCVSAATVIGRENNVGGILGDALILERYSTVEHCLYLGSSVSGNSSVGGIVGYIESNTYYPVHLTNNYFTDATFADNSRYTLQEGIARGYAHVTQPSGIGAEVATYASGITAYENGILYDGKYYMSSLMLANDANNDANIAANIGTTSATVTLADRTLYKDGSWNTLCLPFNLTLSGSILDGDNVQLKTLDEASFSEGTLSLTFVDAEEIEAGKPYIIRWDNTGSQISNPEFMDVTIQNASLDENAFTNDVISFQGIYSPFEISGVNKKLLYLGAGNQLYYPSAAMTINAFRAYFELQGDLVCGDPASAEGIKAFVLDFGEETEETSIFEISESAGHPESSDSWISLSGMKLDSKPTSKGIYIHNGRKIIIK